MKKPTIEDLERIKKELQDMRAFFCDIDNNRNLFPSEINVFSPLEYAIDNIDEMIFYLPDLREGVIDDC